MVHFSGNPNASLSEGEALAIVVGEVPEMPHQTRNGKHFRRPLRESHARLRLACPPPARRGGAPHERGAGGVSDPPFLSAGAARGRGKWSTEWSTCPYPLGGRSLHRDPCGKAETLKTWSRVVLLNLACPGRGRLAGLGAGNRSLGPDNTPSRPSGHTRGPKPGTGGLSPLGPVRASAPAHG